MPTAFLTGGTGFVGAHVARALSEQGWRVRLLARDPDKAKGAILQGVPADIVAGDLSDGETLARYAAGADAIVHVAGRLKARTLEEYREVNLRGTQRLLDAAGRTAPDALLLYVSSQAAAGPSRGGRPVSESDPALPVSWYGQSKREGELAVSDFWRGPWVILRPSVVFGPGDRSLLVYFRMALSGWIPVPAGRTRVQLIGAAQASLAIARAASRRDLAGRTGFLCEPEPVRLTELAARIACLPARPARLVAVPKLAVRLLGLAETFLETITHRSRPFNADKAKEILAGDWLCDATAMSRDLGLSAGPPLDHLLREAWDWYLKAGWLRGADL